MHHDRIPVIPEPGQARAAEETVNTWPQALPPGVRAPLDLGTLSGYWARGYMPGEDFLYVSTQGLLDAAIWKDGRFRKLACLRFL